MKCLLVVTIALIALAAGEDAWKPHVDQGAINGIHRSCYKDYPLPEEKLTRLRNYEFSDESAVHELMLCLVKRAGLFSEETGFYTDRFLQQFAALNITSERARSSIVKCTSSDEENISAAVRAYRGLTCILINNREALQNMNKN